MQPPRAAELNDHVVIGIIPDFYFPFTPQRVESFRAIWQGWAETGARPFLRPNYTLSGHNMPVFYARRIGEDIAFAARNGMFGAQFDCLTGQWGAQGPTLYVIARMLEHPEMPVKRVLDEFYAAFGPARDAVAAYFGHWEQLADALTEAHMASLPTDAGNWERFFLQAHTIFTPEAMARGRALMEQALAAATGDPAAEARARFIEKGLRHSRWKPDAPSAGGPPEAMPRPCGKPCARWTPSGPESKATSSRTWRFCISMKPPAGTAGHAVNEG